MDRDKLKEYRWAMNGRMMLMLLGIMLIVNAILVNGRYGVNFFMIAADAASGKEESLNILAEAGISYSWLRLIAVGFILITVVEVFAGVVCFRFCNRIDRSAFTMKVVIALLVIEVLFQIFLITQRMASLGGILSALVVPAFLLWSVRGFRKLARLYPDRVYALEQNGNAGAARKAAAPKTFGKSLKERAAVPKNLGQADQNSRGAGDGRGDAAHHAQNVTPAWAIAQWEKDSSQADDSVQEDAESGQEQEPAADLPPADVQEPASDMPPADVQEPAADDTSADAQPAEEE